MSEQKCRKVYVPVNLDVDAEGNIRPRLIRCAALWGNGGKSGFDYGLRKGCDTA